MISMKDFQELIQPFLDLYLRMDIGNTVISCPYWMNKMREGKVVLRGFANGKGSAQEIKDELVKKVRQSNITPSDPVALIKLARRERIGIDCSGLSYRILNEIIRAGIIQKNWEVNSLDKIFAGGINRTNVVRLTSKEYSEKIIKISGVRPGDLVRMMGGKHALLILGRSERQIKYIQSSKSTADWGVHEGIINVNDWTKPLESQDWQEKTKKGDNFGRRYFHPDKGDGIYRLKVFSDL